MSAASAVRAGAGAGLVLAVLLFHGCAGRSASSAGNLHPTSSAVPPAEPIDPSAVGVAGASEEIDALWEQEGITLRALAEASTGEAKGEALLRLGEWERDGVERLARGMEAGAVDPAFAESESARRLEAADDAYRAALPLASEERLPLVLFALGDLHRGRGAFDEAREPLARVVDEFPDHPLALDAAIALGDDAFDAGSLALAMSRYEFAAAQTGRRGAAYARYKLGWCHLNLEDYAEARRAFIEVSESSTRGEADLSLGTEALRDLVLALARDVSVPAAEAESVLRKHAPADRAPRLVEGYARLISESGRDEESLVLLRRLWPEAEPKDALRMLAADLEIAIRRRELEGAVAAARELATLVETHGAPPRESAEPAERALRVAAVTIHGEGRASGDAARQEIAVTLYDAYFRAFPDWEAAYELHHHAGELLLGLKRHAPAERHYTAAVLLDLERIEKGETPGKWLARSAHGAVVAAHEALPKQKEPAAVPRARTAATGAAKPVQEAEAEDAPAPPARALGEPEQRLVEACERYLKALPQGEHVADVSYRRAMVLFGHNRFGAAATAFRDVALSHPKAEVGPYAARLSLDALRSMHRYDDLAELAGKYLATPAYASSLGDELKRLREQALLAAAARASRQGRPDEAAQRYLDFAKAFPKSDAVDRALYNGAASLALLDRHDEAVSLRDTLLRTLPKSPLSAQARERQLADLLALGRFEEAARLAEAASDEARGGKRAEKLHDAIVLLEAAGQSARANALRERFLSNHRWAEGAPAHALALAEGAKGCSTKRRRLERALGLAPDTSWRVVFLSKLARHEQECGRAEHAEHHARAVVRLEKRVESERADALDAVADSALMLAALEVERFRKLPLRAPWEQTLPKKLSALERAEAALGNVVSRGRAEAAVCALVESGAALGGLARALLSAQAPKAFTEEQQLLFSEQLAERAQPLLDRARETVAIGVSRAGEAGIRPTCIGANEKALAELWPERFGPIREALLPLVRPLDPPGASAREILARAPDAPAAWLMAARAELAASRPHSAMLLLERIEADDHLRPEADEWKARALEVAGKPSAALAAWARVARDNPHRLEARRILAEAALERRDYDGALKHLDPLVQADPNDVAVRLSRALALRVKGDATGAEAELAEALTRAADRPEPRLNLGLLLCEELGRPKEGLALLRAFEAKGGKPPSRAAYDEARDACVAMAEARSTR